MENPIAHRTTCIRPMTFGSFLLLVKKRRGASLLFAFMLALMLPLPLQASLEEGEAAYARQDYPTASAAFRSAAAQGDPEAQFKLGILYADGLGVTMDKAQALVWYKKAAEQGHDWAQYNVGSMYYLGDGTPQNYAFAQVWLQQAAEQGNAWALYDLGNMYEFGHGVTPDPVVAYALYNLAAVNEQAVKQARDRLARTLSREQLSQGQALASQWQLGLPLPAPGSVRKAHDELK